MNRMPKSWATIKLLPDLHSYSCLDNNLLFEAPRGDRHALTLFDSFSGYRRYSTAGV
jgi:hypothetical protein